MNVCFSFNEWFVVGTIVAYVIMHYLYKIYRNNGGIDW